MFRFEHPYFLNLLWALPVMLLVFGVYRFWRKRAMARLAAPASLPRLLPGWSPGRLWVKNGLWLLALALLAVAWANPQMGAKKQTVTQESADVFIALDISQSMLAEDVAPSRLDLAKSFARKLIRALQGERLGLIFFAGDAFLQMPLSTDYAAADMFVSSATPDMITAQGTAISRAIDLATESFGGEPGGGRALILITDGESHDDDAVSRAADAYSDGIIILGVGAGTAAGGPIPIATYEGGAGYKRDENGEIVRTRFDEGQLQKLTRSGGGASFRLTQGDAAVAAIRREVDRLQKRQMEVRSFSEYESYFQWFLLPAFLLLLLEAGLSWRSRTKTARLVALLLLALPGASLSGQSAHKLHREGDRHYQRSNYSDAEQAYRQAAEKEPDNPGIRYNQGNAAYRQGRYADAEKHFQQSAQSAKEPALRADALHNMGNAYFQQQKYQEAIQAYENSLRLRPGDPETKVNLQLAKKKRQQQQQNQQNQGQQQEQQNQQQDQQNQQQNPQNQPQPGDQSPQQPREQQQTPSEGSISREQALRLLETAVSPEDKRNARKYRELDPGKHQATPKKDW